LLKPLIVGVLLVFCLVAIAVFAAFGLSNGSGASLGSGMKVDELANYLTILTAFLAATTGFAVSYLFAHSAPGSGGGRQDPST
jgi:hypothetical protein